MSNVFEVIRRAEENYINNPVDAGKYVSFDMHETIEMIDAYLNSKHISGETDSLGREKPFFNIVTAAANIWFRATDIDRKDIRILPDSRDTVAHAFVATVLLQQWMKDARFGVFLNDWGRTLARYGSAVCKFVEKDGELVASVVPWNRLIVDPIDFDAIPRIEKFYLTEAQLKQNKMYDQDVVQGLCEAHQNRETLDGKQQDLQTEFIELYEVHGLMEEELLTGKEVKEGKERYVQQMHVVASVQNKDDTYDDFTLYKGREAKDPYMITHLIKEDGRTLGIGAVEHLFNSQWMVNHSQKNIKDTLDLASKLILQTADKKFMGRNVLTSIETGDIFVYDAQNGSPLTRVANDKPDITALQNFSSQWQSIGAEITSTPDAIRGNTMPSGTPYSLAAYSGAQANSLFELMTENKGLALEDMMREHVIPNLVKKMNTKDEVVAILDEQGVTEIDAMYVPKAAVKLYNKQFKEQMLNAPTDPTQLDQTAIPSPYNAMEMEGQVRAQLAELGNRRPLKPDELNQQTWNDVLGELPKRVNVEVTNENTDKQAVLTTLSSLLQTVASNPAVLQDPNAKMLFNAILIETGRLSPLQLHSTPSASPPTRDGGALEAINQVTDGTTATSPS